MDTNIIYLAGIVDGEGCIGIYKNSGQYMLNLRVTSSDGLLMDWLVNNWGGNIDIIRDRRPTHTDCYCWKIRGGKAIKLLHRIYDYLIIKKEQANIAFKF